MQHFKFCRVSSSSPNKGSPQHSPHKIPGVLPSTDKTGFPCIWQFGVFILGLNAMNFSMWKPSLPILWSQHSGQVIPQPWHPKPSPFPHCLTNWCSGISDCQSNSFLSLLVVFSCPTYPLHFILKLSPTFVLTGAHPSSS